MAANMRLVLRAHKRNAGRIPKEPPRVWLTGNTYRVVYREARWRTAGFTVAPSPR